MTPDLPEAQGVFLKPRLPEGPRRAGLNRMLRTGAQGAEMPGHDPPDQPGPSGFSNGARRAAGRGRRRRGAGTCGGQGWSRRDEGFGAGRVRPAKRGPEEGAKRGRGNQVQVGGSPLWAARRCGGRPVDGGARVCAWLRNARRLSTRGDRKIADILTWLRLAACLMLAKNCA